MKSKRLHAYQVMLRVARVKEIRASMVLAEAATAENRQRTQRDSIVDAREHVVTASRTQRARQGTLDLDRYEMLTRFGEVLGERLDDAESALSMAGELSRERAAAAVTATRHRENIAEHIDVACLTLEQEHSANVREDAIELWLKGRSR